MRTFISYFITFCLLFCFPEAVEAQEDVFIPYRSGYLWGYADTNSNIVVLPIYDQVLKQEKSMFLVKKEQQKSVLTFDNKVVVPFQEKTSITLTEDYILSQKTDYINGQPVTSKIYYSIVSGRKTFPSEISSMDEIELVNKKYYRVHTKTGKQGLVKVSENYEGIEEWYIDTSFVQIKTAWSVNYVLLEKDSSITKFSPDFTISEIDSLEKINYISEVPEDQIFEDLGNTQEPVWKNYSLLKVKNGNNFHPIVQKKWLNENGKEQLHFDTLSSTFHKIDILIRKKGFNINDDLDDQVNHKKQLSIAIVTGSNGKKGLINSFGELVVPMVYDSISNTILLEDCQEIHLICYRNKKCGVINIHNKVVIPFEFDKLFLDLNMEKRSHKLFQLCYRLKNGIVARKANKFGIVNGQGEVLGFQFDRIKHIRSTGSFQLLRNDKYGILQSERSLFPRSGHIPAVLIDPVFLYPIDGVAEISGYLLGIVLNRRSQINGYVDTKGFNYFED